MNPHINEEVATVATGAVVVVTNSLTSAAIILHNFKTINFIFSYSW
jgi:hypothetical protein